MEPELKLEPRSSSAVQEQSRLPALAAIAAGIAVLYFAKDVFLPLAIAVLLTFMLAPIASASHHHKRFRRVPDNCAVQRDPSVSGFGSWSEYRDIPV
jgi:predicted PurR-regulated permease PerM